jgi:hypothetical protein
MSKEVDSAVREQYELYGRISRSVENLKKAGSGKLTVGLVEARLQALEANWSKFEAQHDKLMHAYGEALAGHDYKKKELLILTEESFLTQKGAFLDLLHDLRSKQTAAAPAATSGSSSAPRTTLPRIQLPQFSGKYEDWPSFRDLFHSIIGKDETIAPVEKLHYLKSSLKGEAELLVRNLPTTDENFDRAWKTLADYYQNKRLLVRSYISRFLALQKLKGESASDMRKLYHGVMSTVGALESIGRPITRGEDLFVYLIVELLDPRSCREWESAISSSAEPPSYAALQKFLDKRLHTLESLQLVKTNTEPTKTTSPRQPRSLHARKQDGKRGRCALCQKEHY